MIVLVTGGARSGKSSFAEQLAIKLTEQLARGAAGQANNVSEASTASQSGHTNEADQSSQADQVDDASQHARVNNVPLVDPAAQSEAAATGWYIATAEAGDGEMSERIALHVERREAMLPGWPTIEEPFDVAGALRQIAAANQPAVVLVDCLTLWLSNWLLRTEHDDPHRHIERELEEMLLAAESIDGYVLFVTNEVGDGIVPEYSLGRLYRDEAGWMNQRVAARSDKVFLVTAGIPIELKSIQYEYSENDWQ